MTHSLHARECSQEIVLRISVPGSVDLLDIGRTGSERQWLGST
jgi:hypothetical protein